MTPEKIKNTLVERLKNLHETEERQSVTIFEGLKKKLDELVSNPEFLELYFTIPLPPNTSYGVSERVVEKFQTPEWAPHFKVKYNLDSSSLSFYLNVE